MPGDAEEEGFAQGKSLMIPPFNDQGYLPSGVHPATLQEGAERFGEGPELRRVEMESVRWLVELARRAGVQRLILNGSFVTDRLEPNDVDCVLLVGAEYPVDWAADDELEAGLPFLDVKRVRADQFELFVQVIFATDRDNVPKGMIEVRL
jgi:hypothetical protein